MITIYTYELQLESPTVYEYTFTSVGQKGEVKKVVTLEFMEEADKPTFNVLLEDEVEGVRMGDQELTGNMDIFRVIDTVIDILKHFRGKQPSYSLFIKGSEDRRNSVYQRRVFREMEESLILGFLPGVEEPEPIQKGKIYGAFLVLPA